MKKIFESLNKFNNEQNLINYWKKNNILEKSIQNRSKYFVFYDGPATANAMPGIHHMLPKLLKDSFCKYKTMQGFKVLRKVGWDTHGLPVEIEVEKSLGFKSKTDIEKYGIENFNKKCKESVFKNEKAFEELTEKMGQFIDLDNAYVTYKNEYIESVWYILNKFFEEDFIYEGHKILPYCTRCGTGLASHEVAQGYKEIDVDTVIVPFKLKDKDEYFLVWTTTPWTLVSNVALAVNPNVLYVKVKSKDNIFILAKDLLTKILSEYEILEEFLGNTLENIEYIQLIPSLKVDKKAFFVTLADYVTTEDGTGIVHIAPAFGEDDYQVGLKYNLPVLNPVNDQGKYTDGFWKDMVVFDADIEIIKYLKENNKIFSKQKMKHNYPHCWRCNTPLLYYAKPSWYIKITKIKDLLIENNKNINWYPSYVGEKRFGNWLENLNDWAISRNRYWGTPLNIWKCECGNLTSIKSIEDLKSKAIEKFDTIELHRPYVDNIHIHCNKCNKTMKRVEEVIDVWFDSGSMPFAQYHHPFENKELFENQFPADFICEGIDQTRGWFYVLLAISTFLTGKSCYKNVLVNDMLLDSKGQKMSKSKGNTLNPFEIINEYSADVVRWYLLQVSPVWSPTKVDVEGMKETQSKFFSTLKNTYTFFELYANTDEVDPKTFNVEYNKREEIDKWLLSKYNNLVKEVTQDLESYDLTKATRKIQYFVVENLSNWYIRRNRRRFWANNLDDNKKAVYNTTYEVLEGLSRLIAPIIPFISEEIYQNLTNKESVHLSDYPICDESKINAQIEDKMDLVRDLISLGRYAREEAKIKVRQPISKIILNGEYKPVISDLDELIKEELNIKEVLYENDLNKYMNFEVKPNFKVCGPIFGSNMKDFTLYLHNLTNDDISTLESNNTIVITLDKEYTIDKSMIEIKITSKDGYNAQMENNKFIILDTNLTDELLEEGLIREFISKVQQMRKTNDYEILDKINIYYDNNMLDKPINNYLDYIKTETLANNIIKKEIQDKTIINELEVGLYIEKDTI